MRSLIVCALLSLSAVPAAFADPSPARPWTNANAAALPDPWRIDWRHSGAVPVIPLRSLNLSAMFAQDGGQGLHAKAIEHSDGYRTRAKIHKYASFATLPLFATELVLGQSLYSSSGGSDSTRGVHAAVGAGIISLFAVNTVTGTWNLFGEGRQESEGRTLRLVHGLLMMAANAGFVATWAAAPGHQGQRSASSFDSDKSQHRNLAIASISTGTAGYLLMLFGNH